MKIFVYIFKALLSSCLIGGFTATILGLLGGFNAWDYEWCISCGLVAWVCYDFLLWLRNLRFDD